MDKQLKMVLFHNGRFPLQQTINPDNGRYPH